MFRQPVFSAWTHFSWGLRKFTPRFPCTSTKRPGSFRLIATLIFSFFRAGSEKFKPIHQVIFVESV
jgi:hypothetical protein